MLLPQGIEPRIAELGKIKIGWLGDERKSKSGGKYRLPVKLDCFIITGNARDNSGRLIRDTGLMDSLKEEYGERGPDKKSGDPTVVLRELPISLLADDPEEVITSQYVRYDGKRRLATCDGETVTTYGAKETTTAPCDGKEHTRQGWKLHTTLRCVIAHGDARFGGYYIFRTTSVITAQRLAGGLLHIQQLTGGVLSGLPMRLVVSPMQVSPDGQAITVYVVHIELRGADLQELQKQAATLAEYKTQHHERIAAAQSQYRALLAAPGGPDEPDDEQADTQQEFHPQRASAWDEMRDEPVDAEFTDAADREPGEEG